MPANRLAANLPGVHTGSTLELGLDPDWVEAVAFAWLAMKFARREPIDVDGLVDTIFALVGGGLIYLVTWLYGAAIEQVRLDTLKEGGGGLYLYGCVFRHVVLEGIEPFRLRPLGRRVDLWQHCDDPRHRGRRGPERPRCSPSARCSSRPHRSG